ncbi:uncharacterized protein LOC126986443 isoform X2 [Eriocheir sinensis]|uniref:uncharacterized protein LOC126986443 isoform X2 n=1 Tax=Eriocheir sinensis TaxID=95602 RepID=UPI0021C72004|nr:uncharacterized protein LOC126986443 isoform X2 [Eriocheir sinensis]XP_050698557.1 uncharacterized protein LOC126986443 isoform X2 [Eriocheir sinensis]
MAKAADMVFANPQLVERYVKFRPTPPPTLINAVVEHVREGRRKAGGVAELCVDLGCGSGQSMGPLAPHFPSVVGVDVSQPQLDMAAQELKHLSNVSFRVGSAEGLPFGANSVSLVTCCCRPLVQFRDFLQGGGSSVAARRSAGLLQLHHMLATLQRTGSVLSYCGVVS